MAARPTIKSNLVSRWEKFEMEVHSQLKKLDIIENQLQVIIHLIHSHQQEIYMNTQLLCSSL